MKNISIVKADITSLETDAIVNAANNHLSAGGGVCGAIFSAAGYAELKDACDKIGFCNTGSAVITPGFALKAKYVIHAVGPIWRGGDQDEEKQLYSTYYESLKIAKGNGCKSIAFPLVSAGIYGYPQKAAWETALTACCDFQKNEDSDIKIVFSVIIDELFDMGNDIMKQLGISPCGCKSGDGSTGDTEVTDKLTIGDQVYEAYFFHNANEPFGFLSNWYLSDFTVDGMKFTSMEQFIMYNKCLCFGDSISAKDILSTDDVARQKSIGRNARNYIDSVWAGRRQLIAVRGLYAKFSQNPELKKQLLDTGDAFLVECAVNDKIWACGIDLRDDSRKRADKWSGQNILGFALMEVRESLKAHE
ncbi:NADAR domain-containing protein [Ruminococcus sp.]|uniref:NADAR domain-containing protein n=1 Tax=Ruminococcus sp. TaxID=41978 RepID=UPI00343DB247